MDVNGWHVFGLFAFFARMHRFTLHLPPYISHAVVINSHRIEKPKSGTTCRASADDFIFHLFRYIDVENERKSYPVGG
jgi:hypothetical protein